MRKILILIGTCGMLAGVAISSTACNPYNRNVTPDAWLCWEHPTNGC